GDGQLGHNSTAQSLDPVSVDTTGALAGKTVTSVSAGGNHTCAVADGAAYCWGLGSDGQLGRNATAKSLVPVAVDTSGVLAGKTVTSVSVGSHHTCAVAAGAARRSSDGAGGRLGHNSTAHTLVPVAVDTTGALAGKIVTSVLAGVNHT